MSDLDEPGLGCGIDGGEYFWERSRRTGFGDVKGRESCNDMILERIKLVIRQEGNCISLDIVTSLCDSEPTQLLFTGLK